MPFQVRNTRLSLQAALANPGFDTKIAHTIVAWECGAHRGMTSMPGAKGPEAVEMFKQGWGCVAALSTHTDGRLYPEGEHRLANLDALAEGRGVVTAVEVSRNDGEGLRQDLARFLTHPDRPIQNFGLMMDPAAYVGAGFISFGFCLAGAAGVLDEVAAHVYREIAMRPAPLGQGTVQYPGVRLYRPPARCCDWPLPLDRLLFGRRNEGPVVDRVRVEGGALMLAALVAARHGPRACGRLAGCAGVARWPRPCRGQSGGCGPALCGSRPSGAHRRSRRGLGAGARTGQKRFAISLRHKLISKRPQHQYVPRRFPQNLLTGFPRTASGLVPPHACGARRFRAKPPGLDEEP